MFCCGEIQVFIGSQIIVCHRSTVVSSVSSGSVVYKDKLCGIYKCVLGRVQTSAQHGPKCQGVRYMVLLQELVISLY